MPACRISPAHLLLVACWMVAISLKDAAAQVSADLALVDGKIWTVNEEQPQAEAAAIWQGRILAVGSTKSIQALIGAETRVIHLNGRRVIPGFHDCHVHLLAGGLQLRRVDLKDAADEAEFGRRLQDCNRRLPPGRWMLGGNWDHDRTFAGKLPTAAMLDVYVPDRPCLLSRYDGHMAVANSKALELAAITAKTEDPSGGEIVRDPASKQPTGILRDTAMRLVADLLPPLADDEIAQAIEAALELARRLGVTSIDDMAGEEAEVRRRLLQCYQQMGREGRLTARIHLRWPLEDWAELADLGVQQGFGGDFVTIGGVKGFIDGSLGSSTAKMWQTYQNEPGSTGLFVMPPDRLGELIRQADAAGLAVAVHAIGDRGNSTLLDLFADVTRTNPPRGQ